MYSGFSMAMLNNQMVNIIYLIDSIRSKQLSPGEFSGQDGQGAVTHAMPQRTSGEKKHPDHPDPLPKHGVVHLYWIGFMDMHGIRITSTKCLIPSPWNYIFQQHVDPRDV